jgi:hypothetical protein
MLSIYAFAVPLKTKSGKEVTEAFQKILEERKCNMLQTDKGTEYLNTTFQSILKRNNIHFYTSENEDNEGCGSRTFQQNSENQNVQIFLVQKHFEIYRCFGRSAVFLQQYFPQNDRHDTVTGRF